MIYDYNFFKNLFSIKKKNVFKTESIKQLNALFKKRFSELGRWGINPNNPLMEGVLTPDGLWDGANRINTHPGVYKYIYDEIIKQNPKMFPNFWNSLKHTAYIEQICQFLDDNFELYFTKNITDVHYNEIYRLLAKSWKNGNISMIIAILYIRKAFPDVIRIEYSFKTGNKDDMIKGIDITIYLITGRIITAQVKSGKPGINQYDGFYYVSGSQNDLGSEADIYIYCDDGGDNCLSSVLFFNNNESITECEKTGNIKVPINEIIYEKVEYMGIVEDLKEISRICKENNISFIIEGDKNENSIFLNEKKIIIYVSDHDHEKLSSLISEGLIKLKQLRD